MSISVLFNGVTYSVPETGEESWGANLTSYFVAISTGALQKSGGVFTLTADADFGANFGIKSLYLKSTGATPIAAAGFIRMANTQTIVWRNNANSGDLALGVDGSNNLTYAGGTIPSPNSIVTLTGTQTLTNKTMSGASNTFTNIPLSTAVTGALALVNGGTGQTTKAPAFNALSPMTTAGDVIIGGASGAGTRLPIGVSAQVLTVSAGNPIWANPGGALHPTIQKFTSSSGTYTSPASPKPLYIRVRLVGGGGGGGGGGTAIQTAGGTGGTTTFGTTLLTATGGVGGGVLGNPGGDGGTATVTASATTLNVANLGGGSGTGQLFTSGATTAAPGGSGGSSYFSGGGGGGGLTIPSGIAAPVNSGAGGGGGGGTQIGNVYSGSGGGAGGYVEAMITSGALSSEVLTFLDFASTDAQDYVVLFDTTGAAWAIYANKSGTDPVPSGTVYTSIPSAQKGSANISAATTAAQVATAFKTAFLSLTYFPFNVDDSAMDGTLVCTDIAPGVQSDPETYDENDGGPGTITGTPIGIDATFAYTVGAAGTAGSAGTAGAAGGLGGSGLIIVEEFYQ